MEATMRLQDCRAFIFDMDGVLIDSENHYKIIEQQIFNHLGLHIDREEHVSYQGSSNPVMWRQIKMKHGLSQPLDELVQMTEKRVLNYFGAMPSFEPMPEIVGLLTTLKAKGIRLALASSATMAIIRVMLAKTRLDSFFDVVVDSLEAGAGKPDPAIFLLAQKKLGIPKEQCIVVEDSTNGIKAALAAGIYCIAYQGAGSEHQDQSAADRRISRFAELLEELDPSCEMASS